MRRCVPTSAREERATSPLGPLSSRIRLLASGAVMANEGRELRDACVCEIDRLQAKKSRCLVVAGLNRCRGAVPSQEAIGTVSMRSLPCTDRQVEARDADHDPTGNVRPPHARLEGRDPLHAFLMRHSHEVMAFPVDLDRLGSGARRILPRQNRQSRSKTCNDLEPPHGSTTSQDDDSSRTCILSYNGILSCFFQGCSVSLWRSIARARAIRRLVECGMITSSM